MSDQFTKDTAQKTANDLWLGIGALCEMTDMDAKQAFMSVVPDVLEKIYTRTGELSAALSKLLAAPGDHMTACDRTMGASHPCTCGADKARELLSTSAPRNQR